MKFAFIEIPLETHDPHFDIGGHKLIIVIEEAVIVTVYGYGNGEHTVTLVPMITGNPDSSIESAINQLADVGSWGPVMVWGTASTIAHVVWDVIQGQ